MTDEQIKAVSRFLLVTGSAVYALGAELAPKTIPDDPIDPPPIDPPVDPPPIDPPPPPAGESEFMRKVVLDHTFTTGLGITGPLVLQSTPVNPFGKSFGVSFQFVYNAPPNMASPLSLRNDENPFFQLFARGPTALGVVFGLTGGGWDGFDVVVDDMVGRPVHVVIGYDWRTAYAALWIDRVLRGAKNIDRGIGLFPDKTPPLIINSTTAGHQSGDLTPIRLVYSVGAAPTQADVDALSGLTPHEPGLFQKIVDGKVVVSVHGPDSALPFHDPLVFVDGRNTVVKQTRNNPPLLKQWSGSVPGDVGATT